MKSALTQKVNTYLALILVGVIAGGASLLILKVAGDQAAFTTQYTAQFEFKS